MEDLEILKNNWEKENQLLVFSKEEIFEMMRRKSLSISRTLLWIGCLEVVLWILFFYIDSNSLTSFLDWKLFFRSVLFLFFIFIISISILLSIYRAVYGSLLQKLKENYKELSKIETNN